MDVRKILVPLSGRFDPEDSDSLDAPAIQTALRLARHLGAQLEVMSVTGPVGPQTGGWVSWLPEYGIDAVLASIEKQGAARRKRARKTFDAIIAADTASDALQATFVENAGEISAAVGSAGRLSDLIVVANSESRWEQPFRPILDAALRQTGRPIFVTPPSAPEKTGQHIAIAWNDTPQSARALAGAMPLLKRGASVTVLTCREGDEASERADPDKVVDFLKLHGVMARRHILDARHRDVARGIIDASLSEGADLLVLGSVIHSRVQSLVFGSLTEEVLKAPRLSALLVP